MTNKIEKISIAGFRGASQSASQPFILEFDDQKPVTLIFGENGTGKSTLVDAIECIATGSTSFKEKWKLGTRKDAFIPTLGKKPDDVALSIQYKGKTYSSTSANTTAYVPAVHVLRRKSLQDYIEADAANRYQAVAGFMDIPNIESAEASLREAYKNVVKKVESATLAYHQAEEGLNSQWEAAGSPGLGQTHANAESWARTEAKADTAALQASYKELSTRISTIEDLNRAALKLPLAEVAMQQAEKVNIVAEKELKTLEAESAAGNTQLVTLLRDAMDYLTESPDTLCPVCEQTEIEASELRERLGSRLDKLEALDGANQKLKVATAALSSKKALHEQVATDFLAVVSSALVLYADEFDQFEVFQKAKDSDRDRAVAIAKSLQQEISSTLSGLRDDATAIQKQLHTLTSVRQFVKTLDDKKAEAENRAALQNSLGKAVEVFEAKRKTYVDQVLVKIAQSVDELYQQIHPQEGKGQIKLELDARKRASLDYRVSFEGKDVLPQPYYSDSHLDTLGLCIFLALAKRSAGSEAIIVLDDVLGSMDQQHLHRTVDMLIAESANLAHIIITTHSLPLRNRFTTSSTGSNQMQLIELKPWSLDHGLRYITPEPDNDELNAELRRDEVT
jgi:DNA repair exonuclease SbcCD ATPase subunit